MAGTIIGTLVALGLLGGVVVIAGFRLPRFGGWLEARLPMLPRGVFQDEPRGDDGS